MVLRAEETAVITNEANSADQKFLISKELLHRAVSINMAALMTKLKRPKERRTAGKVSTLRIEPKKLLINPKSKATQRNFPAPPLTVIPGTRAVATQTAKASTTQRTSSFMP